jgi:hypothetical protein
MNGGKFKRKLSEVNTRAVSRGQNELVGKFKMTGDMVCIWVQVMEYMFQQRLLVIQTSLTPIALWHCCYRVCKSHGVVVLIVIEVV